MSGARSVPNQLLQLASSVASASLHQMFNSDPQRVHSLSRLLSVGDAELYVDFSKQRVTSDIIDALLAHAAAQGVLARRAEMVAGQPINTTESRAVTHMAMRATGDVTAPATLRSQVQAGEAALREFVTTLAPTITHVVNIGIGGSDLGPALLCDVLAATRATQRSVRFVSNIDPIDLDRAVHDLAPQHTMFVVCSKSFGTLETLANAGRAVAWLKAGGVRDVASQIIAVTSRPDRIDASGLPCGHVLSMPESVGGRYSVSSAVSVAIALGFGIDALHEIRDGMRLVDEHFVTAPPADNVPLLLGVIGWWNATVLGYASVAVVPYSQVLALLPSYLQQLMMESNGKSVDRNGQPVGTSSPVVWGGVGTNAQHAFFQLLHQGTQVVPVDFIGHSAALGSSQPDHDTLVVNMLAQGEALAFGTAADDQDVAPEMRAHRATSGNRPSTTLLFSQLTPRAIGALIALYEHVTFVQGVLWGVNSFDQWGVELGKGLAAALAKDINGTARSAHDASTNALLDRHRQWRPRR